MTEEIICKWWNESMSVGVTEDRRVYYAPPNQPPTELVKEYHVSSVKWRLPKTAIRYSKKKINTGIKISNKIIQRECPF